MQNETTANSLRVLIVEDNADGAKMSAMLLRHWGHDVSIAYDGASAVKQAQEYHPHVILLDIGLPDMNGYEVAQHIRNLAELRDVRLIAISGYGREEDVQRSHTEGFDAHLAKPVEMTELQQLLQDFRVFANG